MATTYISGSAGRLKQVPVSPDLAVSVPTLTGLTTTTVAGITGFDIELTVEDGGGLTHYEGPANAAGVIATTQLQGGTSRWTARVSGLFDGDSTAATGTNLRFNEGAFVIADFLYSKGSALGRYGNAAKVKGYSEKFDHKANAVTFTCTLEGHGLLTDPSTS